MPPTVVAFKNSLRVGCTVLSPLLAREPRRTARKIKGAVRQLLVGKLAYLNGRGIGLTREYSRDKNR